MAEFSDPVLGEEAALAQAMLMRDLVRARLVKEISVTAPVVGVDWVQIVPGGVIWEVLQVFCSLTTSATVATRTPTLTISNQDNGIAGRYAPAMQQAASLTQRFLWAQGLGYSFNLGVGNVGLPSPPIAYPPGYAIRSLTSNIDSGDQWSLIFIYVLEWSEWGIAYNTQYVAEQIAAVQR